MNAEFVKTMNAIAEGTPRDINDPTDDTTFERKSKDVVKLYRVSDASGSLEITEVGGYPLSRDMLDSNVSDKILLWNAHVYVHMHTRLTEFVTIILQLDILLSVYLSLGTSCTIVHVYVPL